ncbi:hypothetical protein AMELA_G00183780 [Ameiurus melas]|uniref:Ig-like domain-containing protein n=1 Tax=Ameiurus melas TaxID=219545 RepID=A0A7J6AAI8_AMEME|nr:hypothetical protein AMELA_G00183780 [Ameiurus melas]
MCSCEVHGNPSPKLDWRLSGQTVKSTWEESVNNTTSRSFISIHQSVKEKSTLQCVFSNKMGTNTLLFNPNISECRQTAVLYLVPSLSVVLLLCVGVIGFLIYKLKQLSRKVDVLQRGDTYASLQLSAVQNSEYETLQTNRERRVKKNNP